MNEAYLRQAGNLILTQGVDSGQFLIGVRIPDLFKQVQRSI